MAKLILLYGFAGSGKTTIAKKYLDTHPLDLSIEGDVLINMLGQWLTDENKARDYVFSFTRSLAEVHLHNGKNVLIPYLLVDSSHAALFEQVAQAAKAEFIEIYLSLSKTEAIDRLFTRGKWGEEGLPPLTEKDMPEIVKLFNDMETAMSDRPNVTVIDQQDRDIESTYKEFLQSVDSV